MAADGCWAGVSGDLAIFCGMLAIGFGGAYRWFWINDNGRGEYLTVPKFRSVVTWWWLGERQ